MSHALLHRRFSSAMSVPPGRPKERSLPLGGKARSAKGAHIKDLSRPQEIA
jgi:hypothetical protein